MVSTKHENKSFQGGIFVSISSFKWENENGIPSSENLQVHSNIGHPVISLATAIDKLKVKWIHKQKKLRLLNTVNFFFFLVLSWPKYLEFSRGKVESFTKPGIINSTTNIKLDSYSQKVNEIKEQNSEVLLWI